MVGDDVANQRSLMFSIDLWRHFMKSRWEKVFQAARSVRPEIGIWYHSDGAILDIVPELLDIGVTILNPVQPECVDPVEIKRLLGRRAAIDGAIGTQTTMPFGTPADVKAMVRERVDTLGRDGALILSPTHMLEPEVPVENVLAFFEAVDEINAG
jgi:uroporphyrinogen decarboxylase